MRNIILVLMAVVLFTSGCASTKFDMSRSPMMGTAWGFNGFLVTNYHVVNNNVNIDYVNKNEIYIFYKGKTQKANVVYYNIDYDICILSVDDISNIPQNLIISQDIPKLGDSVYTVGFPSVYGCTPKYLPGCVSAILRHKNGPSPSLYTNLFIESDKYQNKKYPESYILTTIHGLPGNSGAPVFSKDGYVIGILSASNWGDSNAQHFTYSYVLPIKYFMDIVENIQLQKLQRPMTEEFIEYCLSSSKIDPENSVALVFTIPLNAKNEQKKAVHKYLLLLEKSFSSPD